MIQIAVKNNVKVHYFKATFDCLLFCSPDGRIERDAFLAQWKSITGQLQAQCDGIPPTAENVETICPKLEAANCFFIARRKLPDGADMVYFSVKTQNGIVMLVELGLRPGSGSCTLTLKSQQPYLLPVLGEALQKKLRAG